MPNLTLDQTTLFYTRPRTQNAPTLLLIHGAAGSHLDWPAALRRLPRASVYTLDLPGHGRSAEPHLTTIDAMADCIQAFITQLDLQNVVIAGHSMGGAIALTLALRRPPFLRGLVLISTAARLKVAPVILDHALLQPQIVSTFMQHYAWGPTAPAPLIAVGTQRLLETDPAVIDADYAATHAYDVRDQLSQIDLPALVIHGSVDQMVQPKFAQAMADGLPHGKMLLLDQIGHYAPLEAPDAVASAVADFLTRADSD